MLEAHQIRAHHAEMYGFVFENPRISVPLDLYWNILIDCDDIEYDGENESCAVLCDWLCWPVKSWQQLRGKTLSDVRYPQAVEASFYLYEHHPMQISALSIEPQHNCDSFKLAIRGSADVRGLDTRNGKNVVVDVGCEVVFKDIVIGRDLLASEYDSDAATELLKRFFNTAELLPPQYEKRGYVFGPRR